MRFLRALLCLIVLSTAVPACTTTEKESDWPSGGDVIVAAEIERRVDEMPYLNGVAFVHNLERLVKIGDQAVPRLVEATRDERPTVRMGAAWVFGAMGDRRQLPALRQMLDDPVPYVRFEAASSLIELGDSAGFGALVDGLASPELGDRYKCFEALREVTGRDFGYSHDADPTLRRAAVTRWIDWLEGVEASGL